MFSSEAHLGEIQVQTNIRQAFSKEKILEELSNKRLWLEKDLNWASSYLSLSSLLTPISINLSHLSTIYIFGVWAKIMKGKQIFML